MAAGARPIRIAIDARPFAGSPCGYTVYLGSIIECLRKADLELTLLTDRPLLAYYDEPSGLEIVVSGRTGQLSWEQRDLPRLLAAGRYDVYFSGANRGIPLRKTSGTRYVLGLLDVIPYLFFRDYYLRTWKDRVRRPGINAETVAQLIAVARADSILTISQQSARDIRRIFRRRDVTAQLIRLKDVEPRPAMPAEQHFAYLGGIDARKKVDVLIDAFAIFVKRHPGYRLFLIGSNYTSMLPRIERLGIRDAVVLTGFVDHDTKFRILGESQAMVYPSLYEGYGMAIAEGFQARIPVLAGPGGSQAEIGGTGVRPIDPCSAGDIASAMEDMLDPLVRQNWISLGQQQLSRLTDPAIERSTVAYFKEQAMRARSG
jgi:glycosyltransferase involved in cell wall biosynthesis